MSQYFDNDSSIKSKSIEIDYSINNNKFKFYSDNGVFSKNEYDQGTEILVKSLLGENLSGRVLDLGCGIGCLGIVLAKLIPSLYIDMVDINNRAIQLCQKNILVNKIENARVYESNIYSNVDGLFDSIVTNPPIRAGKKVIYEFFEKAKDYLTINGNLYVVIRKNHGAESAKKKLEEVFGNCTMINRDKGFHILKSTNINI